MAWLAITALTTGLALGCGGHTDTVATVGELTIPRSALDHWAAVQQATGQRAQANRRAVLGNLIRLNWDSAEAAELKERVSDAEVRKQLELLQFAQVQRVPLKLLPEEGQLQRLLASPAATAADRMWLVKMHLLSLRVEQRLIARAEQQLPRHLIASFYRHNKRRYVEAERRDIEIFMTRDLAHAQQGKREVLAGKSFRSVAKRLNVSREADHGLVMGLVRGAGEPPFERHVFSAKSGVILGPIEQVLFYVFRVTKIVPPHPQPLVRAEAAIRHRLAAEEVSSTLRPALDRQWANRTSCHPEHIVAECRTAA